MKLNAIHELYPNAYTAVEDNGVIKVYDVNENELEVDLTAVNAKAEELKANLNNKIQAEKDAQVSGNQKLLDLGLTQAEATALTGYTPPTEV